jgi:hypothetical protein
MTTPSLLARFGHRAAPSALILIRVRGDSRSSGGVAGDLDEARVIAGLIYSAGTEKRSVPNAWREIHRRTIRLTNAGGPEAIAAVTQGGSRSIRPSDPGCEPSRAITRSSPPGILPAMVSLLSAPPEDGYLSFPFIATCGWSIAGETENADLLSLRSSKRGGAFYVGSSDCRHLALLRMPAWSECRHAVANNMHALGASLYLAISTVDTVGAQNE